MTDDDKKLVEMLRDDHQYILVEGHNVTDWDSIEAQRFEAADRIEALTSENERLREALTKLVNSTGCCDACECWRKLRAQASAALGETK